MYQYFKNKETSLNLALAKVDARLMLYRETADINFHNKFDKLTEEEREQWRRTFNSWKWNNWHDLQDRLEARLIANYFNYQSYCFATTGIAIYNF